MSADQTTLGVLYRVALFADIGPATLQDIAGIARRLSFDEGDTVYELGESADDIYLLETGRVRFTLGVGNRPASCGSIMVSYMVFGWAALVDDQPRRIATALCLEPSSMLAINGEKLLQVFGRDTQAGFLVMRRIAAMVAHNFTS